MSNNRKARGKQSSRTITTDDPNLTQLTEAIRRKFDLVDQNVDGILTRLNQRRWAISESSGSYGRASTGPNTSKFSVPNLKVQLPNVSGRNPVLVMLVQESEAIYTTSISVGGIEVYSTTYPSGGNKFSALMYAFIGNVTQNKIIHSTILGGIIMDIQDSAPLAQQTYTRNFFYPPSAVLCVDLSPSPGVNEYEFLYDVDSQIGIDTDHAVGVNVQDCQLFAMELGV